MSATHFSLSTILSFALWYAQMGYYVVPMYGVRPGGGCTCRSSCRGTPGKHPVYRGGWKKGTRHQSTIEDWFRYRPDRNVGIVAGGPASLVVLDVDPRNGETGRWSSCSAITARCRPHRAYGLVEAACTSTSFALLG